MSLLRCGLNFRGLFVLLCLFATPAAFAQHYIQTDLVSSIPGVGTNPTNPLDTQLINSWGIARSPTSPWWVSDEGTGLSTLYNGIGTKQGLVVTIPVPAGHSSPSAPTGIVFNGTADFLLSNSMPARFIFVTIEGTIAAWNGGTTATIVVDNSAKEAIYTGITLGELNGKHYLYVANFHSGEIEVYDTGFKRVQLGSHNFKDDDDEGDDDGNKPSNAFNRPSHNFAPFNVQAIGTNIYVAWAKQDEDKEEEVAGPGLGRLTVFDTAGRRLARLEKGPWFNAPWGIAMAPGDFGEFSHALLVGMFGSGQIAAFNPIDGSFLGLMKDPSDKDLSIEGLWAIGFGGGNANSGPHNTLFFTAGPNDEEDGLFGTLVPIPAELAEADEP